MSEYKNINEVPQNGAVARPHNFLMDGFLASFTDKPTKAVSDARFLGNGCAIHTENHYVDEPYVIKADDGAWICALSIGDWKDTDPSRRTTVQRSTDQGQTWSSAINLEPADGPEGSKAVLLKSRFGRIYAFYMFNSHGLRGVRSGTHSADNQAPDNQAPGNQVHDNQVYPPAGQADEFSFRYSDDHGQSWSQDRHAVPVRQFQIDRDNPTGGKVHFGTNSAIPLIAGEDVFIPFTKIGSFGEGLFSRSEGVLIKSSNIMTEKDVSKIHWTTLPDGDAGLQAPANSAPIAEEHSYSVLSDGSIHCVYRTIDGWPAVSYSRDSGHTWSSPAWMTYASGRRVKCSRAASFAWRCQNGNFLYWFHNHGGKDFLNRIGRNSHYSFEDRNPVWFSGGREVDGPDGNILEWSEPEIVLYDDDPIVRISHPDLLEDDGKYFVAETNKDTARVHEVDASILEDLWRQWDHIGIAGEGLVLEEHGGGGQNFPMPWLPDFAILDEAYPDYRATRTRRGFTLELWLQLATPAARQVLADNRTADGRGFVVETTSDGAVAITMRDDMTENRLACDPGSLSDGERHHVTIVVDSGPNIISFVVDGEVNDGGDSRQFGWGRFSPHLETPKGGENIYVGKGVECVRIYARALRHTDAIGNWRAGPNVQNHSVTPLQSVAS